MRKIALTIIMAFLLASCSSNGSVKMENDYKEGRDAIHTLLGIWIPELEKTNLLESSDISLQNKTICFDIPGDSTLFGKISAAVKDQITEEPASENASSIRWNLEKTIDSRLHKGFLEILLDAENAEGSAIYINTQLKPAYRIKLTASQGGSVTLKRGENAITGNETYGITDDEFTLTSTPDNGYLFDGWFNGETKLSGEATFSYTIASADIEIQGKFVQSNMTQSYASRRAEFKAVCGIELPELDGLEVDDFIDYHEGSTSYCFDITGGDNLSQETYTTLKNFFNGFINNNNGLPGFEVTQEEDAQIEWTSAAGTWVQLVWDSENTAVYVNVRAEYVDPIPSTFAEARNCLKDINGIEIPDYEGAEIGQTGASFKKDGTETTFAFTSNELTNTDFNNLKALFSQKFGNPTNEDENEDGGSATWNHEGTMYSIDWVSSDKIIDINIFKTN